MAIPNKSQSEATKAIAGYYGSIPISGTDPVTVKAIGFEAWADSVIASVKDADDVEQIENIQWDSVTIPEGKAIWFGLVSSEITLTSGSGQVYLAE